MAEIVKETVTTVGSSEGTVVNNSSKREATNSETTEYLVYFIFGVLEVLLAFRLVLKFMGASMASSFVGLIYGLSGVFILPFEGIFRRGVSQGLETASVLEPSTIVAILVYAIMAWGIVKLVHVLSGEQQSN